MCPCVALLNPEYDQSINGSVGRNFANFHSNMGGNVELGGERSGGYNGNGMGRGRGREWEGDGKVVE